MKIKVVKESKFFPVVGKVHDVEPSPGVRVLIHKGYIVKVEPTIPYAPIPEETEVTDTTEQAQAAAEDDEVEDDAPGEPDDPGDEDAPDEDDDLEDDEDPNDNV